MSSELTPRGLDALVGASESLRDAVNALEFAPPVHTVYNPLDYAFFQWTDYLTRFARMDVAALLLGMNPGPWGMAQTGVPFGEIAAVRDWMEITGKVGRPLSEHPKRPIEGFSCERSEVSGRRLWGLMRERFVTPDAFFASHFVSNYCPLVFMADTGRNVTPDKLPAAEREPLFAACDAFLQTLCSTLRPRIAIGVGKFAESRIRTALPQSASGVILHPSPASPAANRDWAGTATSQLIALGVWSA